MENVINKLNYIGDIFTAFLKVILGIIAIALTVLVATQFILRWFGKSISFATELSCLLFIAETMLGSALGCRYFMHVGVDVVVDRLHGKVKTYFKALATILLIASLIILLVSGFTYTMGQLSHMATTFDMSLGWFYATLPVSAVFMLYFTIVQLLEIFYHGDVTMRSLNPEELEGGENV